MLRSKEFFSNLKRILQNYWMHKKPLSVYSPSTTKNVRLITELFSYIIKLSNWLTTFYLFIKSKFIKCLLSARYYQRIYTPAREKVVYKMCTKRPPKGCTHTHKHTYNQQKTPYTLSDICELVFERGNLV